MAFSEEDPLLPRNIHAPEIHTSRPQSIKEAYINPVAEEPRVDELAAGRPRKSFSNYITLTVGLCLIAWLLLATIPDSLFKDVFGGKRLEPQTVEQRVNKILT